VLKQNGIQWKGYFSDGKRVDQTGVEIRFEDGMIYHGDWKGEAMTGNGLLRYSDGSVY
jgi:hypothetical protein